MSDWESDYWYETETIYICLLQNKSVLSLGFFSNKMFIYAVGGSLLCQLLVVYCTPLQAIFQTEPLTLTDLITLTLLCSSVLIIDEIWKCIIRCQYGPSLRTWRRTLPRPHSKELNV